MKIVVPETIRTPDGFSIDGAGPELLAKLLADYETLLKEYTPEIQTQLEPGLSESEIHRQFASVGLTVPTEALVWWSWHNGMHERPGSGLRLPQMALERAVQEYSETYREDKPSEIDVWATGWIPIVGGRAWGSIAMDCNATSASRSVQWIDPERGGFFRDDHPRDYRALSPCVPVAWWVTSILNGWVWVDPENGQWTQEWYASKSAIPLDWWITHLV